MLCEGGVEKDGGGGGGGGWGLCHRADSYCNSCVFMSDCGSDVLAVNTVSNRAESGWRSNRNV